MTQPVTAGKLRSRTLRSGGFVLLFKFNEIKK
jgi:hypothetical protein